MTLLIITFTFLILLSLHIYHHYRMIEKKNMRPDYLLENIKRGFTILFFTFVSASVVYWLDVIRWALLYYSIFFLVFDYALNLARGKNFFYQGDGIADTFTDKALKKIGPYGALALKVFIFALSLIIFYFYAPTN